MSRGHVALGHLEEFYYQKKKLFCVVKIIKIDLRVLVFLSLYHSSEIGQPVKTYFILKHVKVCQERRLIKTS